MPSKNKHIAALFIAIDFILLSIGLFLWLCWTAAADAQGAIAFFLYAPVLFAFTAAGFFLGKFASAQIPLGKIAKTASLALAAFFLFFYLSPFVGLNVISDGVIGGVAKSFKMMTGKSPMEWSKE